jgi:hypothetical protein
MTPLSPNQYTRAMACFRRQAQRRNARRDIGGLGNSGGVFPRHGGGAHFGGDNIRVNKVHT